MTMQNFKMNYVFWEFTIYGFKTEVFIWFCHPNGWSPERVKRLTSFVKATKVKKGEFPDL